MGCLSDSKESDTSSALLYNISFEPPTHTVGMQPAIGHDSKPRNTVTDIMFGTPTVAGNFGGLASQSLEFDSSDLQGDQIRLSLIDLPSSDLYCFEADVLVNTVSDLSQPFTILFDTPQVRNISFYSDGTIRPYVPFLTSVTTGNYSYGIETNIRVKIDLALDEWQIFVDGTLMHSGGFGGATDINSIRVSTPVILNPTTVLAAIDNIRVSGDDCPTK